MEDVDQPLVATQEWVEKNIWRGIVKVNQETSGIQLLNRYRQQLYEMIAGGNMAVPTAMERMRIGTWIWKWDPEYEIDTDQNPIAERDN